MSSNEAVCSLCVRFRQAYWEKAKIPGVKPSFTILETSLYQEHLRLDHGIKPWEPIPA